MKTFAYAAAAAVACLATQTAAYDETTSASGFSFVPPTAYPTEAQVLLMCLTSDCYSLVTDILTLQPADCVIDFGTVSINVLELADSFLPNCTALEHQKDETMLKDFGFFKFIIPVIKKRV
ncbi:hypothetical protein PF010_g20306 [Phytophthora fragariae]|uniref:Elicitin n=1 Tax=Phytophthora fragariae TaxID=53985 RepID=A0A6A3K1Y3_9STRA|nr:hypothetical protein PF011_g14356 [Phytophthora fragariae]KAE9085865.1 hypothetical protein PF010_g20306 [Phytophthora fragariae]KAE9197622.1 hypothetical protein PF004_g19777 [Phytophthora fragariae]